jgi:hypothetical protein
MNFSYRRRFRRLFVKPTHIIGSETEGDLSCPIASRPLGFQGCFRSRSDQRSLVLRRCVQNLSKQNACSIVTVCDAVRGDYSSSTRFYRSFYRTYDANVAS